MYAAVDMGGTKTLIAVFDAHGNVKEQFKFPTPKDYPEFLDEFARAVDSLETKHFTGACMAIPGKVDRINGVGIAFGNLAWEKVPIQIDAENILACPVIIENDANLAGLSEALLVLEKYRKSLYVTVSTGIGGGYITDGIINPDFADAEIGQTLLEHRDRLMRWEDFASGRAIVERFGKKASEINDDKQWYVIARNIAIGLINLIATLTPDVIIIGGGVGTHILKFKDRLDEQLKIYENPMLTIPPIIQAQRPEEAVIYGCYELAKRTYGSNST
jgi:predicted NBD/HSP70 family sugar kinase